MELLEACKKLDLNKISQLIEAGADANFKYSEPGDYFGGDSTSALFEAVNNYKGNEKVYYQVIELLLKNGADPNFSFVRSCHRRVEGEPTFVRMMDKMATFKDKSYNDKLVNLFVKGLDLTKCKQNSMKKGFRGGYVGYAYSTYKIFELMNHAGLSDPLTIRGAEKGKAKFDASLIETLLKGDIDPNLVHHYEWCEAYTEYSDGTGPPTDWSIRHE